MSPNTEHLLQGSTMVKAGIGTLILSFALAFTPIIYQMIEEIYMPPKYWFEYHSITPEKTHFKIGEKIRFVSERTVKRPTTFVWQDALYCDFHDGRGMGTYSIYESVNAIIEPQEYFSGPWTYHAPVPVLRATCELRSTVTAKLRYRDKVQFLKSPQFEVNGG